MADEAKPGTEFTPHTETLLLSGEELAVVCLAPFVDALRAKHPEAHDYGIERAECLSAEDGRALVKVTGAWRPAGEAAEAKDESLASLRLRTPFQAQAYVNQILVGFLEQECLPAWKRTLHAGETPEDRKEAHLALEAAQAAIKGLTAASIRLMARSAPVVMVDAGGSPNVPPPGERH